MPKSNVKNAKAARAYEIGVIAMYGVDDDVEYATVAVQDSQLKLVRAAVLYLDDFDDQEELDEAILEALGEVTEIRMIEDLLPPETCPCCDEPMVRTLNGLLH